MKRLRGLTLIEMLVVITILVMLAAFLLPQVGRLSERARITSTEGLIQKLSAALNSYHADFQDYPPDGFDGGSGGDRGYTYKSGGKGGVRLGKYNLYFKNTGCLVYFLLQPLNKVERIGATVGDNDPRNMRISRVGPYLSDMKSGEFNIEGFSVQQLGRTGATGGADMSHVEIVDAFGRPLEYDKVKSRRGFFNKTLFDKTGGSTTSGTFDNGTGIHWPESELGVGADENRSAEYEGAPYSPIQETIGTFRDPRRPTKDFGGSVAIDTGVAPAPKNAGQFDIWSHGPHWSDPNDDIGNW